MYGTSRYQWSAAPAVDGYVFTSYVTDVKTPNNNVQNNNSPPSLRYQSGLLSSNTVRPLTGVDTYGNTNITGCGLPAIPPSPGAPPTALPITPYPCVLDLSRINISPVGRVISDYQLHVWGWKHNQAGINNPCWSAIGTTVSPLNVSDSLVSTDLVMSISPVVNINTFVNGIEQGYVDPFALGNITSEVPITSSSGFYQGVNVLNFTPEAVNALLNNIPPIPIPAPVPFTLPSGVTIPINQMALLSFGVNNFNIPVAQGWADPANVIKNPAQTTVLAVRSLVGSVPSQTLGPQIYCGYPSVALLPNIGNYCNCVSALGCTNGSALCECLDPVGAQLSIVSGGCINGPDCKPIIPNLGVTTC